MYMTVATIMNVVLKIALVVVTVMAILFEVAICQREKSSELHIGKKITNGFLGHMIHQLRSGLRGLRRKIAHMFRAV